MTNWPPQFTKTEDFEWGVTPFDNLSADEAKLMLCALYSAVSSMRSCLAVNKAMNPDSPYWSKRGTGGRALAKANSCMAMVEGDDDERSEKIYRCFFRYADDLLFPGLDDDTWKICDTCKTMTNPGMADFCAGGTKYTDECPMKVRPITWDDLKPTTETQP